MTFVLNLSTTGDAREDYTYPVDAEPELGVNAEDLKAFALTFPDFLKERHAELYGDEAEGAAPEPTSPYESGLSPTELNELRPSGLSTDELHDERDDDSELTRAVDKVGAIKSTTDVDRVDELSADDDRKSVRQAADKRRDELA